MTVKSNMFSEPVGGIIGVVSVQDHQKIHANATLFTDAATEINIRIQLRTDVRGVNDIIEELSKLIAEIQRCGVR